MKKIILIFILTALISCTRNQSKYWIEKNIYWNSSKPNLEYTSSSIIYLDDNSFYSFTGNIIKKNGHIIFDINDGGVLKSGKWYNYNDTINVRSKIIASKIVYIVGNQPIPEDSVRILKIYLKNDEMVLNDSIIFVPLVSEIDAESLELFKR